MNAHSLTDVSIELPSWQEVARVLTLSAGYNSAVVVAGTTCLGLAGGLIGTFLLLRKRALLSDALAHSSLPGLCIAFLIATAYGVQGRQLWVLLLGAAVSGVIAVVTVQFLLRATRLSPDAVIGSVLSVFFAVGVVLLSLIQSLDTGSEGGINHFIYGQTAAMQLHDVYLMTGAAVLTAAVGILLFKEFRLVCFDEEFAKVQGFSVTKIDFLLMSAVTIVTVVGLQAVGVILVVAILIVPPAAARFWTESLGKMAVLSAFFGAASGYAGSSLSALMPRMPAGAIIVTAAGAIFLFSFLFARQRGFLAGLYRRMRQQFGIAEDHLLREVFEQMEVRKTELIETRSLQRLYQGRSLRLTFALNLLRLRKLVALSGNGKFVALTPTGLELAKRRTRNHRLWEEFLLSHGQLASSHVDYSADLVEHVLSAEIVSALEKSLQEKGIKPKSSVPPSVHSYEDI